MILYELRLTHGRWGKNRGRTAAKWCSGPADLHGKRVKILTRFILRSSTRRVLERSERKNLHARRPRRDRSIIVRSSEAPRPRPCWRVTGKSLVRPRGWLTRLICCNLTRLPAPSIQNRSPRSLQPPFCASRASPASSSSTFSSLLPLAHSSSVCAVGLVGVLANNLRRVIVIPLRSCRSVNAVALRHSGENTAAMNISVAFLRFDLPRNQTALNGDILYWGDRKMIVGWQFMCAGRKILGVKKIHILWPIMPDMESTYIRPPIFADERKISYS